MKIIINIAFTTVLVFLGFLRTDNLAKASIESVEVLSELALVVHGVFPSPAYELDHSEVEVNGNQIDIATWARFDSHKIVPQVLVAFQDTISVDLTKNRLYEVTLHSRNGTKTQAIWIPE